MKRLVMEGGAVGKLRLSKPGFNVDTATVDQLLFDLALGKIGGVYMRGVFARAAFVAVGSGLWRVVVPYGKTFASPPICVVNCRDQVVSASAHTIAKHFILNSNAAGGATAFTRMHFKSTTTQLEVYIQRSTVDPGWLFPEQFQYTVMQVF